MSVVFDASFLIALLDPAVKGAGSVDARVYVRERWHDLPDLDMCRLSMVKPMVAQSAPCDSNSPSTCAKHVPQELILFRTAPID
jgi:hypothetical protein